MQDVSNVFGKTIGPLNVKLRAMFINCGRAHHVSICEGQRGRDNSFSQPNRESKPDQQRGEASCSNDGKTNSNHVTVGLARNFRVGSDTRIALQTAVGVTSSADGEVPINTRILFDAGSHRSFITSAAVKSAKLLIVRQEWLCINAFGQCRQEGTLRDVVQFNVSSVDGGKSISTVIVPI